MADHKCSKCGEVKVILANSKGTPYVGCRSCAGKPKEQAPAPKPQPKPEEKKEPAKERFVDHWL